MSAGSITSSPAVRARESVYETVAIALIGYYAPDADPVPVSADAGAFHPAPLGVLIGLPALSSRTMRARTYLVPVHVVSADPLNTRANADALLALADELVVALGVATWAPTDWSGGVNRDALPSVQIVVIVTVPEEE